MFGMDSAFFFVSHFATKRGFNWIIKSAFAHDFLDFPNEGDFNKKDQVVDKCNVSYYECLAHWTLISINNI